LIQRGRLRQNAGTAGSTSPFVRTRTRDTPPYRGSEPVLRRRPSSPAPASMRLVRRFHVFEDRLRSFAQPWEVVCFLWVPALGIAYASWFEFTAREALADFGIFRTAAHAVVH